MKAASFFQQARSLLIIPLLAAFAMLPQQLQAQESDYLAPPEPYSREELAQMLAPIALYPDALLSQVLMASTYPIEVIEADRWVRRNPNLKGEALDTALLDKDWDPSVKAICHFPSILALMSERISETTNLGTTFVALPHVLPGTVVLDDRAAGLGLDELNTEPFASLSTYAGQRTFIAADGRGDLLAGGTNGDGALSYEELRLDTQAKIERILVCTGGRGPGLGAVELGGRVAGLVGAEVEVAAHRLQPVEALERGELEALGIHWG